MEHTHVGLSLAEVEASRERFGGNRLTPASSERFVDKLAKNLNDPIIVILLVALAVVGVLALFGHAEWYEGVGIAVAVAIATLVSTWSEHRNESAFQRLQEEAARVQVKVFRDGRLAECSIDELVVGDRVLLQPGDKVPADGVLRDGRLSLDQAALTGESTPVEKRPDPAAATTDRPDDLNAAHWLFRGAIVIDGRAVFEVCHVGDRTVYGRLARELAASERPSPLKVKLAGLGRQISRFGYIGALAIAAAFTFKNVVLDNGWDPAAISLYLADWSALLPDLINAAILAIIIIVVAVPEGLPMMIAIVLAQNMGRLLADRVLVRKLLGIEAAGSLSLLFSDKTGTLTTGQLEVATVLVGPAEHQGSAAAMPAALRARLVEGVRYNTTATLQADDDHRYVAIGADRTEQALFRYLGPALDEAGPYRVSEQVTFSSARKFSAARLGGERSRVVVKGAPEVLLANCTAFIDSDGEARTLDETTAGALEGRMDALAGAQMRLLAVAEGPDEPIAEDELPQGLTLVAVFALRDGLRAESPAAVAQAQEAGIQVVMLTGDKRETAEAIARDLGLLEARHQVVTSADLRAMDDEALGGRLPELRVVARALPSDKTRLVDVAQAQAGAVVGMTGDGINDAPALKRSDVGFAMGSGTDVAKEAGDIVVLDDNFASLTRAVLYGRTLFHSIRKFIVFQLTVNLAAILVAFIGPFLGYDFPLTMIQLLWINLIMDTLAALAFSGEPPLRRYMADPPIRRDAPLVTADMASAIAVNGVAMAALSLTFLTHDGIRALFSSEAAFLSAFFAFFVFINNFNKFNARTTRLNLFEHLLDNRAFLGVVGLIFALQVIFTYVGGELLRTVPLSPFEWLVVIGLSLLIIPVDLARKATRDWLRSQARARPPSRR